MQRNLGANAGLDYAGWGALLRCIAGHSLQQLAEAGAAAATTAEVEAQQRQAAESEPSNRSSSSGSFSGAGRWYHAFRLQRAGLLLQQLVEEQQRIDSGSGTEEQQQWQRQEGQQPSNTLPEAAATAEEAPFHAAEAAANAVCLQRIAEQRLHALGPRCNSL